jgi:hypothetical protein
MNPGWTSGDEPACAAPPAADPRARRVRWLVASMAIAAVAAASAVVVAETHSRDGETAAAAGLTRAAAKLEARRPAGLAHGQYWFVRAREVTSDDIEYALDGRDRTVPVLRTETDERWIGNDGTGGSYATPGRTVALTGVLRH